MANIAQPDLSVFGNIKTVNDFDRLRQEFELKKQLAAAELQKQASGQNAPAAIQIVNEMQRAQANGDVGRYNLLHQVAKSFAIDRGMTPAWDGAVAQPGMNPMLPALVQAESSGNPNAVSPKGAAGAYQIMPDTARDPGFGVAPLQNWDGVDPRTAPQEEQKRFANDYLNAMQARNGGDPKLAAASYNAGPGRVDAALSKLPAETRNYVQKVAGPQVIPGYADAAASISGAKAGAEEQAKKDVQLKMNPQITAAEERAKPAAKALGEADAELNERLARQPQLDSAVKRLSALGQIATYTGAGKISNALMRQAGLDVPDAAVARTEYISRIDNEILPLLRQTFGAQFTEREGNSLKTTLGDPNKSPQEKDAVLRSFIQTKMETANSLARQTGRPEAFPSKDIEKAVESIGAPPAPKGNALNIEFKLKRAGYSDEQIKAYKAAKGL